MRAIKNLFVLVIIVAMLVGVGAVALRVMRGKPSGVEEIKQGIVMASSVSSYVYAAKVGNKVILFDAGADPDGKPIDAVLGWLHAGAATSPTCSSLMATATTPRGRRGCATSTSASAPATSRWPRRRSPRGASPARRSRR